MWSLSQKRNEQDNLRQNVIFSLSATATDGMCNDCFVLCLKGSIVALPPVVAQVEEVFCSHALPLSLSLSLSFFFSLSLSLSLAVSGKGTYACAHI